MSASCIFCQIVKGAIPCSKIAETSKSLAFLDVSPLSRGHVLVIPKTHADRFHEMDEESAADIGVLLSKVSRMVAGEDEQTQYNILQNNGKLAHQEVHHVHFHVIPKRDTDTGLKIGWETIPTDQKLLQEDAEAGKNLFEKLNNDKNSS